MIDPEASIPCATAKPLESGQDDINQATKNGNGVMDNSHTQNDLVEEHQDPLNQGKQLAGSSKLRPEATKTTDESYEFQVPEIHCRKCKTIPDVENCEVVSTDAYSGKL